MRAKDIGVLKRQQILDALREAGSVGVLSVELQPVTGSHHTVVSQWLKDLTDAGIVGWWPDPVGRCANRRRWWLAELRPARCPPPSGVKAGHHVQAEKPAPKLVNGILVVPGWTHDARYQVGPGERVVGVFSALGVGRYLEGQGNA